MRFDEEVSKEVYRRVIDLCAKNDMTLEEFLILSLTVLYDQKNLCSIPSEVRK